jgi:hypothetical protein
LIAQQLYDAAIKVALAAPHGEARAAVVREAWTWLDTPWVHENRRKGAGVDCGNLMAGIMIGAKQIEDITLIHYPHDFYNHSGDEVFRRHLEEFADKIDAPGIQIYPGDILGHALGKVTVAHTSMVMKWPVVIHAVRKSKAVVFGDADKGVLAATLSGVWRLKAWC